MEEPIMPMYSQDSSLQFKNHFENDIFSTNVLTQIKRWKEIVEKPLCLVGWFSAYLLKLWWIVTVTHLIPITPSHGPRHFSEKYTLLKRITI
jgi:hypothetical protein